LKRETRAARKAEKIAAAQEIHAAITVHEERPGMMAEAIAAMRPKIKEATDRAIKRALRGPV
jgi:hypothetical protein